LKVASVINSMSRCSERVRNWKTILFS